MWLFMIILTLFPVITSLVLRGRFYKLVLGLGLANSAIAVVSFILTDLPTDKCLVEGSYSCHLSNKSYMIVATLNILASIVLWYMAFARAQTASNMTVNNLTGNQMSKFTSSGGTPRVILKGVGWLIVLSVLAFIGTLIWGFTLI